MMANTPAIGMTRTDWIIVGGIAVLAAVAPLPLYLVALSCFGLPHVLCELAWVRRAVGPRLPSTWWLGLAAILAIQAGGRLAAWKGWITSAPAIEIDVLTLALALWLVLALPLSLTGWRIWLMRGLALGSGVLLSMTVTLGSVEMIMALLVGLSVLHNVTPLGLARLGHPEGGSWAPGMGWMILLPLLLLPLPWLAGDAAAPANLRPMELNWLQPRLPFTFGGLFSALVLAQCLHYYAVLRLLPRGLAPQWPARRWVWLAVAASLALTLGFLWDFPEARRLYALAGGIHSWLEWPVLLCLLGGVFDNSRRDEPCVS
jgi:hypothetical protein